MADYREFSRQIKEKYPAYKDVDDLKLAKAMIEKYPQYESQVTFDNQTKEPKRPRSKGIDLTSSGLANNATPYILNSPLADIGSLYDLFKKQPIGTTFNNAVAQDKALMDKLKQDEGVRKALKRGDFMADMTAYTALPQANVFKGAGFLPNLGNSALTGLEQGGIIGGLEGLKNDGLSGLGGGVLHGGLGGAAIGAGLPVLGQTTKLLPMAGGFVGKTIGRLQPETLQRAINPESIALDLTPKQAQNLLTNTTERVRNAYNNLLGQKGEAISAAENNLLNITDRVKVKSVLGDIRRTFDKYGGEEVNIARNLTGNLENNLNELIENAGKQIDNVTPNIMDVSISNDILAEQELLNEYNTLKSSLNKKYGSIDNLKEIAGNDIKQNALYGERFDSLDDYRNLLAYEQLLQNAKYIDNRIPSSVNGDLLGNGNIGAIPTPQKPKETPFTISAIDLQKMKQQVGQMTNWADTTRPKIQNTVLEQIYGKMRNRLEDLSPELAAANKDFAVLKSFQENEGLKRILRPGDNIDNASTALRNYDSSVTKGNTGRNVQDLEKVLTNAGEEPFLNTIDDINAAMDLNNIRSTGDSFWANVGTALTRPGLKLARAYNRSPLPKALYNAKTAGKKLFLPLMYNTRRLFGDVEYNDY